MGSLGKAERSLGELIQRQEQRHQQCRLPPVAARPREPAGNGRTAAVANPRSTDINLTRLAVSSPVINTNPTLTATSIPTRARRARRLPRDSPVGRDPLCRTSNGAVREIISAGAAPARRLAITARISAHPAPIQSICRGPRKSSAGGRYRCMAGTMAEAKRMPKPPPAAGSTMISRIAMRTISARVAPKAAATAICCLRPTARANRRFVTLTQPTNSRHAAATDARTEPSPTLHGSAP